MNTRDAGWYDDPQDSNVLRYWDGVTWTEHTSPRQKPGLGQAGAGQGYGQSGQGYGQPGQYAAPGNQPQYGQAPQQGDQQGQYQYGQQAGGWGQPMPGGAYTGTVSGPSTPDGQPLAGWGMRLLARIIDGIVVGVVGWFLGAFVVVPDLSGNFMDFWDKVMASADNPGSAVAMPADLTADLLKLGLVIGVLGLLYEVLMLKAFSATLGKMATGLRVRLRDQDGPLSWATAGIRGLVWQGPGLLSGVQVLSFFASIFNLLNGLWPLWDKEKQSLNDKFAKTNVVKKRP